MGRDWKNLPPELLQVISKKVTSLTDYIRFCAVFRLWQSVHSLRPDHLPLQLPWLMLPYQSDGNNDSTRRFYDLSDSKIHELDLPETRGVDICGSSHGWLFLQKGQGMSLLNPITGATISLPPFTGPLSTIGIVPLHALNPGNFFENWDANEYAISPTDNVTVCKAILTSSAHDSSCRVFVFTYSAWPLAFCKIGDVSWKAIEFQFNFPWGGDFCDITYSNGFLYTVSPFAEVTMYDLNNRSRTLLGGNVNLIGIHLVEGVSGDILLIHDRPIYVTLLASLISCVCSHAHFKNPVPREITCKQWTIAGIFILLNISFVGLEIGFRELVVKGVGMSVVGRVFYGFIVSLLLCAFVLFALVVQTAVYFVCKSYHHESIDKSNLSDHLEVYLGEYVPLTAKDVQLEPFHV